MGLSEMSVNWQHGAGLRGRPASGSEEDLSSTWTLPPWPQLNAFAWL